MLPRFLLGFRRQGGVVMMYVIRLRKKKIFGFGFTFIEIGRCLGEWRQSRGGGGKRYQTQAWAGRDFVRSRCRQGLPARLVVTECGAASDGRRKGFFIVK
jgi:hypothetical protein